MNIDRKRYPIIEQVQKGKLNLPMTSQEFGFYFPYLPIAEAIVKSKPVIDYLCTRHVKEVFLSAFKLCWTGFYTTKGIILVEIGSFMYSVKAHDEENAEVDIFFYDAGCLRCYCKVTVKAELIEVDDCAHSIDYDDIQVLVVFVLSFVLFKKHVQVREKVISTKKSRICQTSLGTVKTDFKYPINVIDENYYTTFIRSGSFSVKGHSRHYKKSGKTVFIEPFEKAGYTKKARVLALAA